ncbi:hypothetical protein JW906_06910 [bacterium]|nr:hypothetical protein [bacterium]
MIPRHVLCFILFISSSALVLCASSAAVPNPSAPRIYLDCDHDFCDMNFIRREIDFVDYVIDRKEADIHILVTRRQTGSGGREVAMAFIGRNGFAALSDTLVYSTSFDDTWDMQRERMVQYLKLGLVPFINRTPLAGTLDVSYNNNGNVRKQKDKWNNWIFRTRLRGWIDGEKMQKSSSVNASLSADHVTEAWKIRLSASGRTYENRSTVQDSVYAGGDTTYVSSSENRSFNGLAVRSLSDHWSAGLSVFVYRSTYENIRISYGLSPAVEYDIFPYSESTRRELRLIYRLGARTNDYEEITIYDRLSEMLLSEEIEATLELRQPWGDLETSVSVSHYFRDLSKYRINFWAECSVRLFKGFSVSAYGHFSRIHDQLSLVKGGSDLVEILLRRRQLATQYSYYFSLGFEYAFGSLFNNVVNPRFGY